MLPGAPDGRYAVGEAGCGWGPASVFCARRLAARVTAVDRDPEVFPFVDVLARLNDVQIATAQATFARMGPAHLNTANLLIGSDICFWDSLVAPLATLVRRALDCGVERVVLADPGRAPFFALAERLGRRLDAELLDWYAVEPKRFEGSLLVVHA